MEKYKYHTHTHIYIYIYIMIPNENLIGWRLKKNRDEFCLYK